MYGGPGDRDRRERVFKKGFIGTEGDRHFDDDVASLLFGGAL
jgi:hypothetical protein